MICIKIKLNLQMLGVLFFILQDLCYFFNRLYYTNILIIGFNYYPQNFNIIKIKIIKSIQISMEISKIMLVS